MAEKWFENITGKRFGKLVAYAFVDHKSREDAKWLCICDCGNTLVVCLQLLKRGSTKSCGCLRKKHKMSDTRIYKLWKAVRYRCNSDEISLCDRWKSFDKFYADVGEPPHEGARLHRIDRSKGYSPENCRWATRKEQANNRRDNVVIEFEGQSMTLTQWSEALNINRNTLDGRISRYGWTIERAFTTPVRSHNREL